VRVTAPGIEPTARQLLVAELADLCRADPAAFAEVVRHSDALERQGLDRSEAIRRALDERPAG
jgi:hypothetical protein